MAQNRLERYAMIYQGAYDPQRDYVVLDCVYHDNSLHLCIVPCKGQTPGESPTYWVSHADVKPAVQAAMTAAANANTAADEVRAALGSAVNTAVAAKDAAVDANTAAQSAKDIAVAKAGESATAAQTATTKAVEAAASAQLAQDAAASVNGEALFEAVRTHPHDGTVEGGVKISYSNLSGAPDSLPANDVHDWAKQPQKPEYNATEIQFLKEWMLNNVYRVGAIWQSQDPTSPAELFGGTWSKWPEGRFPVAAGANYPAGGTGGSATHAHIVNSHLHTTAAVALTVDQLAAHAHKYKYNQGYSFQNISNGQVALGYGSTTAGEQTVSTGSGQAHGHGNTGAAAPGTNAASNLPPWRGVHIWERVA